MWFSWTIATIRWTFNMVHLPSITYRVVNVRRCGLETTQRDDLECVCLLRGPTGFIASAIAVAIVSEYAVPARSAEPKNDTTSDGRGLGGTPMPASRRSRLSSAASARSLRSCVSRSGRRNICGSDRAVARVILMRKHSIASYSRTKGFQ